MEASFLNYPIIDGLIIVLLLAGGFDGLLRGLSREIMSAITTIVAILAGTLFYMPLGELIATKTRIEETPAVYAISFLLCMCMALILVRIVLWIIRNIIDFKFRPFPERFFGFIAGAVRMSVYVAAVLLAMTIWNNDWVNTHIITPSKIAKPWSEAMVPFYEDLMEKYPDWNVIQPIDSQPNPDEAEEMRIVPEEE